MEIREMEDFKGCEKLWNWTLDFKDGEEGKRGIWKFYWILRIFGRQRKRRLGNGLYFIEFRKVDGGLDAEFGLSGRREILRLDEGRDQVLIQCEMDDKEGNREI